MCIQCHSGRSNKNFGAMFTSIPQSAFKTDNYHDCDQTGQAKSIRLRNSSCSDVTALLSFTCTHSKHRWYGMISNDCAQSRSCGLAACGLQDTMLTAPRSN